MTQYIVDLMHQELTEARSSIRVLQKGEEHFNTKSQNM